MDTFDVLDEDIFCYVKWEDVPFLFDGSEGGKSIKNPYDIG